ncbi:MAG TPA: protein kinase [Pyrinomonadaceae bacterium]|nr:protein kinase [Pyrinomonadaceae bacterium]
MADEKWRRVREVFDGALSRKPEERQNFVNESCGEDKGLLAEVESLLSSHDGARSFMETPAVAKVADVIAAKTKKLETGKCFGHYEVVEQIGEGGMGEVYLARDKKLDRNVAIKILNEEFSQDESNLQRFVSEAKAASALNHPNILTIYEFGEAEDARFIVSEHIEGKTLREIISASRLRLSEILDISIQITSALAAAHKAHLVHRDIKPENIMVRPDGYVKVLDFGLAKLVQQKNKSSLSSEEPTVRQNLTAKGVVVGTVNYMSPEQAKGERVDERTDIFSLGVLIYEMVAGKPPFAGANAIETMGSILNKESVPLSRLRPEVPQELERIINKALRKDREERYQTAKDLLIDLKDVRQDLEFQNKLERTAAPDRAEAKTHIFNPTTSDIGTRHTSADSIISSIKRHKPLAAFVVISVALIVVGFGLYKLRGAGDSKPPAAAWKIIPLTSFAGPKGNPAFSPDGRQIAFCWTGVGNDNFDIYVKLIGEGTPLRLTTNPGRDWSPSWSPDGRQIAFTRYTPEGNSLMTVPSLGGAERKLASLTSTAGGHLSTAWSMDGKELAFTDSDLPNGPASIFLISLETGERRRLTTSPPQSGGDFTPRFSPDGQWVAFTRSRSNAVYDIYIVPAAGGEPRPVTRNGRETGTGGFDWTADGREIVFSSRRGSGLFRIPITGGTPEQLPGIGENSWDPAISRRGDSLAYVYHKLDDNIWRAPGPNAANRDSPPTQLIASTRHEGSPRYSPDGKRIAFVSDRSGNIEIWTCDAEGGNPAQLTRFDQGQSNSPRWSPDGQHIAFDARPTDHSDIYVVGADGGAPRRLTTEPSADIMPMWSTDGRWIYFGSDRGGDWQIWKMPAGGGEAVQMTKGGAFGTLAATDEFLYYSRRSALPTTGSNTSDWTGAWRIPVAGGNEERVFDQGTTGMMFITPEGVCFFDPTLAAAPAVKFFNFASRQVTTLVTLDPAKIYAPLGSKLAVSPDGQWVLYSQLDQNDLEIMLVENFR